MAINYQMSFIRFCNSENKIKKIIYFSCPQKSNSLKRSEMNPLDAFFDLDPLGTGKARPFVDKKDFFNKIKNPQPLPMTPMAAKTNTVNLF